MSKEPNETDEFWTNLGLCLIPGLVFALLLALIMGGCTTVQSGYRLPPGYGDGLVNGECCYRGYPVDGYGWDNRQAKMNKDI